MMPENILSSESVPAELLVPTRISTLIDYEWGGIALNDTSQGLNVVIWQCFYADGFICVKRTDNETVFQIIAAENVSRVGLAFDFNMRPTVCYIENGVTKLYWYNTQIASHTITTFADVLNMCISLDDSRLRQSANADIIAAYQKSDGGLYYRQQRDRFSVERLLATETAGRLWQIGMNRGNRLQFNFRR